MKIESRRLRKLEKMTGNSAEEPPFCVAMSHEEAKELRLKYKDFFDRTGTPIIVIDSAKLFGDN